MIRSGFIKETHVKRALPRSRGRREETFHVGRSLGRILERIDTQSGQLADLKTVLEETDEKVSWIVREFGFTKKAGGSVCSRLASCRPS